MLYEYVGHNGTLHIGGPKLPWQRSSVWPFCFSRFLKLECENIQKLTSLLCYQVSVRWFHHSLFHCTFCILLPTFIFFFWYCWLSWREHVTRKFTYYRRVPHLSNSCCSTTFFLVVWKINLYLFFSTWFPSMKCVKMHLFSSWQSKTEQEYIFTQAQQHIAMQVKHVFCFSAFPGYFVLDCLPILYFNRK